MTPSHPPTKRQLQTVREWSNKLRRRTLCRMGRHDWQLIFVQSQWSGETWAEKRWMSSTYQCQLMRRLSPAPSASPDSASTHTLEIDDTWEVVYTLGADDGQPVVREMQIRPQRGKPLPAGGLSTRAVRQIKLGEHLAIIRTRLAHIEPRNLQPTFLRDGVTSVQGGKRLGRPSQPDTYYATMALAYVDALKQGSRRPVADVAKAENYSPSHVRDALNTARERGLLTRPKGRGRADGKLTEKAIGLLTAPDSTKARNDDRPT